MHQGRGYRDSVRRGHEPTRSFSKETRKAHLLDLGRYIRTVGDPNGDRTMRRKYGYPGGGSIPEGLARAAALEYDAFVQRHRAAAAVSRGHDRDFAQNRDRHTDRNRDRNRNRNRNRR